MQEYGIAYLDGYGISKNIVTDCKTQPDGACTARSNPTLKYLGIYIGMRFPILVFLSPAWFVTSIHRLCIPLAIKHSAMTLMCSPCTIICFNFGLRGSGCTVAEDAHAVFSPSARPSASRRKISKPDM